MIEFLLDLIPRLLPCECLELRFMQRALVAVALLAPTCAVLGVPVVNLRLAFFTDAIGHAALTGVAAGLLIGLDPRGSTILLALVMGAVILLVQRRSGLGGDTVIGVLSATVVAAGLAVISRHREVAREANRFLFGDVLTVTNADLGLLAVVCLLALGLLAWRYNRLALLALNPDLAQVHRRAGGLDRWLFALLLALTAVLAVRVVGVLLVTALIIIPAATARILSRRASAQPWLAGTLGLAAGVGGLLLSAQEWAGTATGPTIVLLLALAFVIALLAPRRAPGG